tara:strand:+ start:6320 stop:8554 length:2235 start_codon:yes stop_codon:yes gene_type:complete
MITEKEKPKVLNKENNNKEILKGIVKKIKHKNTEKHFYIIAVECLTKKEQYTVLGHGNNIHLNDVVSCEGGFVFHTYKGKTTEQFKADIISKIKPTNEETILEYLSSGIVKGIGKKTAKQMVDIWGCDALDILDKKPNLLLRLNGVGEKTITKIINSWSDVKPAEETVNHLINIGFNSNEAVSIYKKFQDKSLQMLTENPYLIHHKVYNIKFEKLDAIAVSLGIDKESPYRIFSTIEYFLAQEHNKNGSTIIDYNKVYFLCKRYLKVDDNILLNGFDYAINNKKIFFFNKSNKLYIQDNKVRDAEMDIAQSIYNLTFHNNFYQKNKQISEIIKIEREGEKQVPFDEDQKKAIIKCVNNKISILTGKPGTGKTTVLNEIVKQLKYIGRKKILLCAPTGKAAQKMRESTGIHASTIHRLLEFNPMKDAFEKNIETPLDTEVLIIDEASMIDTFLMANLLRAISTETQVILIGDVNQLPSVQCGAVLRDFMNSGVIPFSQLENIHRTGKESDIITTSHEITNTGEFNVFSKKGEKSDLYFIETNSDESTISILEKIITTKIKKEFNFEPEKDVQVLTAVHKGLSGTKNLNRILQNMLNKNVDEYTIKRNDFEYKVGDKIIQIKNNYEKDVYNGDCGTIINMVPDHIEILFDDKIIFYKNKELEEILPAYCISIHKSQGSEYPVVIMPFNQNTNPIMERSLIYTGITRGKKLVILIGNRKMIESACKNEISKYRETMLKEYLINLFTN